jgi:hypothetical protein
MPLQLINEANKKSNILNIVSYNRTAIACKQFLDKHATILRSSPIQQQQSMFMNVQHQLANRIINLSPTTIPTLLANGSVVEDSSQFQQIINERKCKLFEIYF